MGLKNGEKKGILFYYNYLTEMEALSDTQKINILFVLAEIDLTGKIEKQKSRFEDVQKDPFAYTMFKVYLAQQNRASTAWHNINKSKNTSHYNDRGEYIPVMGADELIEQATKKSQAEEQPPEDRASTGIVMNVDMEKGLLMLDNEEVFSFDVGVFGTALKDKVGRAISLYLGTDNNIEDFCLD